MTKDKLTSAVKNIIIALKVDPEISMKLLDDLYEDIKGWVEKSTSELEAEIEVLEEELKECKSYDK